MNAPKTLRYQDQLYVLAGEHGWKKPPGYPSKRLPKQHFQKVVQQLVAWRQQDLANLVTSVVTKYHPRGYDIALVDDAGDTALDCESPDGVFLRIDASGSEGRWTGPKGHGSPFDQSVSDFVGAVLNPGSTKDKWDYWEYQAGSGTVYYTVVLKGKQL